MRPMRGSGGFGGGIVGLESMAAKLAVGLVAGSVLFALTRNQLGPLLLLYPHSLFRSFAVWQPFTYAFIETSPMGVIFGALIIWSIGGNLEATFGPRRLLMLAVGCTAVAAVLTGLLAFVMPVGAYYAGGNVMTSVLWVAYGLSFGRTQTNFWGLPVSGNLFAGIGLGFVLLNGAFAGFAAIIPDLVALVLAFLYVRGGTPRTLWLKLQHWRLQRQLRGRSKHLKVVRKDRSDSDQFLN